MNIRSALVRRKAIAVIIGMLFLALILFACVVSQAPQTPGTPTRGATATRPLALPTPTDTPTLSQTDVYVPLLMHTSKQTTTPTPRPTMKPTTTIIVEPTPLCAPALGPGYGINVKGLNYSDDSLEKAIALGFEWVKIYDHPPPERLPFKVLYRVNLPRPEEDWAEWGHYRYLDAKLYADRIDAYVIGNEPNLIKEWGRNPDPAAYAELLEIAYREIKSADPDALVISAGLATVGAGSDPRYVNDLAFLRAMYEHGAADHFDVLGVHPFGFAYPPETPPDGKVCRTTKTRPAHLDRGLGRRVKERWCWPVEGLCFRRVEQLRAIMLEYGDGQKPVWASEFGWIIRPPTCCRSRLDWPAYYWQVVSEQQQAQYIVCAFAYAQEHWPWMEAMFLWNLDYSRYYPGKDETCLNCESMGWYSILNPDGSPRLAYKWLAGQDRSP